MLNMGSDLQKNDEDLASFRALPAYKCYLRRQDMSAFQIKLHPFLNVAILKKIIRDLFKLKEKPFRILFGGILRE